MTKNLRSIMMLSVALLSVSVMARAELVGLDDQELQAVDGEGIGFILEDFAFEAGTDVANGNRLDISGIKNKSGQDVVLSVSQLYIAGSGSNRGTNVIGNPVNLGRLLYPYNLELVDGDSIGIADKAVFEYSAPQRSVGSASGTNSILVLAKETRAERRFPGRPASKGQRVDRVTGIDTSVLNSRPSERADFGIRFDLEVAGSLSQSLEAHARGAVVDGSYVRLWGDNNEMVGNLALKFFASDMVFYACDSAGSNCGRDVRFQNFVLESELGWGEEQPVTFKVNSGGNFTIEVGHRNTACADLNSSGGCSLGSTGYAGFYNNGPRSNIHIGNVSVGNSNFGSATISNMQIQYLRATSRDL